MAETGTTLCSPTLVQPQAPASAPVSAASAPVSAASAPVSAASAPVSAAVSAAVSAPVSAAASDRIITLVSEDGITFEVRESVISRSTTIRNFVQDMEGDVGKVPVSRVDGKILAKVIEYCEHYQRLGVTEEGVPKEDEAYDREFVDIEQGELLDLVIAANFLDIRPVLDLCCKTIADHIKGKTPEQLRKFFNITSDFNPEEEEEIRQENQWAFQ
jgi:S-phase kinase-associated protein 1